MRYLSLFSGIEAASVAWKPLGWEAHAFAEIEPFPCAVLAHHYPDVRNYGDVSKFKEWPDATVDVLVGGSPCQAFSVAGLRKGLDDPRGNLTLTYLAVVAKYRPRWVVWENVPGVLSIDGGRVFGAFLGGLGQLGYGFAYRVLDAQYFGVAQRRRRVFVVGYLGDWRRAAAVLFERQSLRGDPAPSRAAGKAVAEGAIPSIAGSLDTECGGARLTHQSLNSGHVIGTITARMFNSLGARDVEEGALLPVAHSLRAEGFDASEDGTGRGTPLVPVAFAIQHAMIGRKDEAGPQGKGWQADVAFTQDSRPVGDAVVFDTAQITSRANRSRAESKLPASTLAKQSLMCVAFNLRGREGGAMPEMDAEGLANIRAASGGSSRTYVVPAMQVRRLTPVECCRLQGFPDTYLDVIYRGKPAADGPRYKALGNSMAVPCMAWIGRRIALVDAIQTQESEAAA